MEAASGCYDGAGERLTEKSDVLLLSAPRIYGWRNPVGEKPVAARNRFVRIPVGQALLTFRQCVGRGSADGIAWQTTHPVLVKKDLGNV
jgi:hypothetical protein